MGDVFVSTGEIITTNDDDNHYSLYWEVRQHHNTHWHPFMGYQRGNNLKLQPSAPPPEDFLAATNSHLEIIVTAVDDDGGIQTTASRIVLPQKVVLQFDLRQQQNNNNNGIIEEEFHIWVDDSPVQLPAKVISWVNHELQIDAKNQGDYIFGS